MYRVFLRVVVTATCWLYVQFFTDERKKERKKKKEGKKKGEKERKRKRKKEKNEKGKK